MLKSESLKLEIELVPSTAWHESIYQICTKNKKLKVWQEFKEKLFLEEGRKCYICGQDNIKFEAHEFWNYDGINHIQKLIAIHHLCHLCHKIKHTGLWFETDYGLENLKKQNLTTEDLIDHFCKVNKCTKEDFLKHKIESFKLFNERSKYNWIQDFGKYNYLLKD